MNDLETAINGYSVFKVFVKDKVVFDRIRKRGKIRSEDALNPYIIDEKSRKVIGKIYCIMIEGADKLRLALDSEPGPYAVYSRKPRRRLNELVYSHNPRELSFTE